MAMQIGTKRPGPPPPRYGIPRPNFSFRMADDMRERLIKAARRSGRSLADEIRFRLERSFTDEQHDRMEMLIADLSVLMRVRSRRTKNGVRK